MQSAFRVVRWDEVPNGVRVALNNEATAPDGPLPLPDIRRMMEGPGPTAQLLLAYRRRSPAGHLFFTPGRRFVQIDRLVVRPTHPPEEVGRALLDDLKGRPDARATGWLRSWVPLQLEYASQARAFYAAGFTPFVEDDDVVRFGLRFVPEGHPAGKWPL